MDSLRIGNMPITEISVKYGVELATIVNHNGWVKAVAVEIDLDRELHLAVAFDSIMKRLKGVYPFAGVSSNNFYWNLTPKPIRIIFIPLHEGRYITIINPEIMKLKGKEIDSVEGCGSIPDFHYMVKRKPVVSVGGYTLNKEYIELEYSSEHDGADEGPVMLSYNIKGFIIQHEMDHLNGITIRDKGTVFDLNRLMANRGI